MESTQTTSLDSIQYRSETAMDCIEVVGARTHNLKNISCSIRRGKLTVVTGLSGSGKSSLAFDTLYAEGQRRYVESLSTYARQFLEKIKRPEVDAIHHIPPAIALEQKNSVTNARSTIGTATEINDYLRLLFAKIGHVHCPDCSCDVSADSTESAAEALSHLPEGTRLLIVAPISIANPANLEATLAEMRAQGFARALREDGTLVPLEEFIPDDLIPIHSHESRNETKSRVTAIGSTPQSPEQTLASLEHFLAKGGHDLGHHKAQEDPPHLVTDTNPPLSITSGDTPYGIACQSLNDDAEIERVAEGDEKPYNQSPPTPPKDKQGFTQIARSTTWQINLLADRLILTEASRSRLAEAIELAFRAGNGTIIARDADTGAEWRFSTGLTCNSCRRAFRKPEPALFSFASPLGACPACEGFGRVIGIDMGKVIPDRSLSLKKKAIAPWNTPANRQMYAYAKKTAPQIPQETPISEFTPEQWRLFMDGEGDWCGVQGFFKWFEGRRYKVQARVMLAKYRAYTPCPECGGTRLQPDALTVKINGQTIADIWRRTVEDLHLYFDNLCLPGVETQAVARLLTEIRSRLHYLDSVGLGYLTLDRQTRTLSGGESQRINLATALGGALTDTLYVLDEPTVGLHSRDTLRLLGILKDLREAGNTVVVVEHDPDIVLGADDVIDMGPASGDHGGQILYAGPIQGMANSSQSVTARHLVLSKGRKIPSRNRAPSGWVIIRGACENNLKNLDVRIPRGVLCCITGVSGSGKSTLVHSVLHAGFRRLRDRAPIEVGRFDRIEGSAGLADILLVDQKPIGRSARSNPITYAKAYDPIRVLFASTNDAKRRGIKAGSFSFNVAGGRCEECEGAGVVTIDMHFLADVEVTCDKCDGKRFKPEVLGVEWHGKNIDDVLGMTVNEAQDFFAFQPKILKALAPLDEVGLGYIRLGQSTSTLSGGEAQRLKLAGFLAGATKPENLMLVFDEPTTGLHAADVERLTDLFQRLVDRGASILIIEHNLDLIGNADWIIDLGPEGGDAGGHIVAEGPPRRIMGAKASHTGRILKERFS